MLRTRYNAGVTVMGGLPIRAEDLQFVHPFEVPAQCSPGAFHIKSHLTLVSLNDPADFQAAVSSIGELHQGAGNV